MSGEIPKIIHQIWLGPRRPPKRWMRTWSRDYLRAHPDWSYRLWTETEVQSLDLELADELASEPTYMGKSDLLRYEILDQLGGVYIDADSIWLDHSLDTLCEEAAGTRLFIAQEMADAELLDQSFIARWLRENGVRAFPGIDWEDLIKRNFYVAQGVMGCPPGDPRMRKVIDHLKEHYARTRIEQEWAPWIATGPVMMSALLSDEDVTVFPSTYFYPVWWHGLNEKGSRTQLRARYPASYMFHHGYTSNHWRNVVSLLRIHRSHRVRKALARLKARVLRRPTD